MTSRPASEFGKRPIADPKLNEIVSAAPIAWDGLVFVGNAGGDFKGAKGRMYALDAKTGKIVWEFFLVPKTEGDIVRGPQGKSPLDTATWKNATGIPISGGGSWTSYTLDPKTGLLYVPGGNPAPDFAIGAREGENFYTDSVVVLDAKTGDYRFQFKLVPKDWHDWDVSNPPILIQTRGGKQLMVATPKDGYLYAFDLANNSALYKVPVTRVENVAETFSHGQAVHFCPGAVGGAEWNGPSYVPQTNLVLVGEVEWCDTATPKDVDELRRVKVGQPWAGMWTWNPFNMFGRFDKTWAGWVYAVDADTGVWKWRLKSNYPIVGGMTPTAGGVVFFGDVGGNFYALDSATGQKLWGQDLGGAIGDFECQYEERCGSRLNGGSGLFHPFVVDTDVRQISTEIAGGCAKGRASQRHQKDQANQRAPEGASNRTSSRGIDQLISLMFPLLSFTATTASPSSIKYSFCMANNF